MQEKLSFDQVIALQPDRSDKRIRRLLYDHLPSLFEPRSELGHINWQKIEYQVAFFTRANLNDPAIKDQQRRQHQKFHEEEGDNRHYMRWLFWLYIDYGDLYAKMQERLEKEQEPQKDSKESRKDEAEPQRPKHFFDDEIEFRKECNAIAKKISIALWGCSIEERYNTYGPEGLNWEPIEKRASAKTNAYPVADELPYKWPPHVSKEDAFSEEVHEGVWLSPHNHFSLPRSGREEEWKLLDEFCRHDRPFMIGAVIAPSGAGKTRLVSEWMRGYMAKYQDNGWDAGFVDSRDAEPWYEENWTPTKNTLIVIDYTYNYDQVIGTLIDRFKDRSPHKIRLLVLDHILPDKLHEDIFWKSGIESQGFLDSDPGLFPQSFRIHLKPEQDDSLLLRDVIAFAADPRKPNEKKRYNRSFPEVIKAAEALMRIAVDQEDVQSEVQTRRRDSVRHPLFAALVGKALGENPNEEFNNWSRRDLITHYLERRQRIPWINDKRNKYAESLGKWVGCYVCAATLLRGVPVRHLRDQLPQKTRKQLAAKRHLFLVADIANRIVSSEDKRFLRPFEPDILGEAFLLRFLGDFGGNDEVLNVLAIMLGSFKSAKKQEEAATAFQETLQRLVRNLINDDQELEIVKNSWDALLELLNPEQFPPNSLIRQAVSIALCNAIKQCRAARLEDLIPQFSEYVEIDDLDEAGSGALWLEAATAAAHYYDWLAFSGRAESRHEKALCRILKKVKSRFKRNWSALMLAAEEGCLNTLEFVQENFDEDVNDRLDNGATALILASENGHSDTVDRLLAGRASVDLGMTDNGWTALILASLNGHSDTVDRLLAGRASVDLGTTDEGWTALMWASLNGHSDTVDRLLAGRATVDLGTTDEGWTALMMASESGHTDIVDRLLAGGATIDLRRPDNGSTALMWASLNGHAEVVEGLLVGHASVDLGTTHNGWTALMLASWNGHLEVVDRLLAGHASVDQATTEDDATALMMASQNGHAEVVNRLLRGAANPNIISNEDGTALDIAIQENHQGIVDFLRGWGAKTEAELKAEKQ